MADVTNPHDVFVKKTFGKIPLAAEFFRHYLPPELARQLDTGQVSLVKGSFVDKRLRQHFSDLLFRVGLKAGGAAFIYILLEHKSAPDELVARQLLRYLSMIWERLEVDGKLPLVIPVVFYHGAQRWTVPLNFGALVPLPSSLEGVARPFVPEFRYYLCDLSAYNDEALPGGAELQAKLSLLKHIFAKDFLEQLPRTLQMLIAHLPLEEAGEEVETAIWYAQHARKANEQQIVTALEAAVAGTGDKKMETVVEKWKREARQTGLEQGQQQATASMALLLLQRKFGPVKPHLEAQIRALDVPRLQELGLALLGFTKAPDLAAWLKQHAPTIAPGRAKN
jgi:predicted transposase/invertase (TIGR01784 family)